MVTYYIHSNGLFYRPNYFEMLIRELRINKRSKWPRQMLNAFGFSQDAINRIAKGMFHHHVEGETVVVTIH